MCVLHINICIYQNLSIACIFMCTMLKPNLTRLAETCDRVWRSLINIARMHNHTWRVANCNVVRISILHIDIVEAHCIVAVH